MYVADDDNIYTYADNNLQIFAPRSLTQCATAEQLDRFVQLIREKYFNGGNVSRTMLKGYVDVSSFDVKLLIKPNCIVICCTCKLNV